MPNEKLIDIDYFYNKNIIIILLASFFVCMDKLIILKISIPSLGIQKALKCKTTDKVWVIKNQIIEKIKGSNTTVNLNFDFYLPKQLKTPGKYLEERKDFQYYGIETNVF